MIINRIKNFINETSSNILIIDFLKKIFSLLKKLKINHLKKLFRKRQEKYCHT